MMLCEAIKEYRKVKKLSGTTPKLLYDISNNSYIVTWYYSDNIINKVYNNLFVKILIN